VTRRWAVVAGTFFALAQLAEREAWATPPPYFTQAPYFAQGRKYDVGFAASGRMRAFSAVFYLFEPGNPRPAKVFTVRQPHWTGRYAFSATLIDTSDPSRAGTLSGQGFDADHDAMFERVRLDYRVDEAEGSVLVRTVTDPYQSYACWPDWWPADGCAPAIAHLSCTLSVDPSGDSDLDVSFDYHFEDGLVGRWALGFGLGSTVDYFDLPGLGQPFDGTCVSTIDGDVDGAVTVHCTAIPYDLSSAQVTWSIDVTYQTPTYANFASNVLACPKD